jgi:hypothetical protein
MTTADDCAGCLRGAGWSVGEVATAAGWAVYGSNGENVVSATAPTQAEAWRRAVEQARAVGTAGK